jgi:4-amino-4-deoxy-L-arabinose transferase-like glycosyltransferase
VSPAIESDSASGPIAKWEWVCVAVAVAIALGLGCANLGVPSLWHDEAVHAVVAQHTAAEGVPALPSGRTWWNGLLYTYLLAAWIHLFGDGEAALRAPSVLLSGLNVLLAYWVLRPLIGRGPALVTAFALAMSPWSVAWARQARFYALHQTLYLAFVGACWAGMQRQPPRRASIWLGVSVAFYALGLLTAFHSVLFLGTPALFACALVLLDKEDRGRWWFILGALAVVGALTAGGYWLTLNQADFDAIFKEGGLGGQTVEKTLDRARADALFYFRFLQQNLSTGYFLLFLVGTVVMVIREGRRGLYVALAFWVPILVLNFLIGYRRYRFMYFAYPFYVAAYSYVLVYLAQFFRNPSRSPWRVAVAVIIAVFGARLAWSTVHLVGDSLDAASGSHATLARRHPQWRGPCNYVAEHGNGAAILTTTFMPTYYYVGHVDNWYPSRYIVWEFWESGQDGLKDTAELAAFVQAHPKGYFLAELRRFGEHASNRYAEDVAWVEANMKLVEEASSGDVFVYAWGLEGHKGGAEGG